MRQELQYLYGLLIIVALLVGGCALLNRPQFFPVVADVPVDFPADTFSHRDSERLAYWLYGYNAYVIKSVLDNWPLESVTPVTGSTKKNRVS